MGNRGFTENNLISIFWMAARPTRIGEGASEPLIIEIGALFLHNKLILERIFSNYFNDSLHTKLVLSARNLEETVRGKSNLFESSTALDQYLRFHIGSLTTWYFGLGWHLTNPSEFSTERHSAITKWFLEQIRQCVDKACAIESLSFEAPEPTIYENDIGYMKGDVAKWDGKLYTTVGSENYVSKMDSIVAGDAWPELVAFDDKGANAQDIWHNLDVKVVHVQTEEACISAFESHWKTDDADQFQLVASTDMFNIRHVKAAYFVKEGLVSLHLKSPDGVWIQVQLVRGDVAFVGQGIEYKFVSVNRKKIPILMSNTFKE
jgi:hypothetical protein